MSEDTHEPPEHLFSSLRLSDAEFTRYQRAADTIFKKPIGSADRPIKVVGYGEDAAAAIKASNAEGRDYLEVQWSPVDSMLWIMQRLEEQLHIPLKVWRLAGDGMVLDPGLLVAGHSLFKKDNIELFLVPGNVMADYLAKNQKEHTWKQLTPGSTDSSDYLEKAKAAFHLFNPKGSKSWENYFKQRTRADATFKVALDQFAGEEMDGLLEQIRSGFEVTLSGTGLTPEQQQVFADGIVPFRFQVEDNWGDVADADVMTRIYSPTKPSAVDVFFTYHHRTRYYSVEFDCRLMYRLHDPVSSEDLALPSRGSAPRPGRGGWKLLFELGLADLPPGPKWRAVDQLQWGLRTDDVDKIRAALFGTGEESLAKDVDKVDTILLLMAAVGVPFGVARAHSERSAEDEEDEEDGQDPGEIATIQWELDQNDWIALNIRKVCGVPLPKDANYKPRSAYDEDDEYPDDDEDDEEDDDDDF